MHYASASEYYKAIGEECRSKPLGLLRWFVVVPFVFNGALRRMHSERTAPVKGPDTRLLPGAYTRETPRRTSGEPFLLR